ncbi:hypothetical protein B0H11DRAFT_2249760 [Mycena galericulata]|nr:hypothetical protein B0H11DRAFT_2249760 [Mycena galericulata]
MVAPRFDDEDDDNLIRFLAHPGRLLKDRNPVFKLLGPEPNFVGSQTTTKSRVRHDYHLIPAQFEPEEEEAEEERTPTPPPKPRKLSVVAPKKTPRTIVAKQDDILNNLLLALTSVVESVGVLRQRMEEESSEVEEEEEEEEARLKPKLIRVKPAAKKKYARTPPKYEEDGEEEPVPSTKVKAVVVKAPRKAPVGKPASKG